MKISHRYRATHWRTRYTRRFFRYPGPRSNSDRLFRTRCSARSWLKGLYSEAGLTVREDPVGNTFARWHADPIPSARRNRLAYRRHSALRPVRRNRWRAGRTGSHPGSAARRRETPTLHRIADVYLRGAYSLWHRMPGQPPAGGTSRRIGRANRCRIPRATRSTNCAIARVHRAVSARLRLQPGYYAAFAELHIEQGPLLERREVPLGVVTAIAAPASLRITVEGAGWPRRRGADARPPRCISRRR